MLILVPSGVSESECVSFQTKSVPWLPTIIMGSVAIAVGLIGLNLPETFDKPLPQNIDDINRLYGKKKPGMELNLSDNDNKKSSDKIWKTIVNGMHVASCMFLITSYKHDWQ